METSGMRIKYKKNDRMTVFQVNNSEIVQLIPNHSFNLMIEGMNAKYQTKYRSESTLYFK